VGGREEFYSSGLILFTASCGLFY